MRWGVRDEMTNEHMTTALCMTELRNCQRLSMGPNFIYFGAQKYGYRLVLSGIKYTLLNVFKNNIISFVNLHIMKPFSITKADPDRNHNKRA